MIGGLTVLLLCQLAGEVLARTMALPVPGPVIGMVLLFTSLLLRDRFAPDAPRPDPGVPGLGQVADALLTHLGLLFIPAGVGVVVYGPQLARWWAPMSLAIVIGTLLTIALTGRIAQFLMRRMG
ncbi:CidA/LrgA family protein [Teichococcus vastitatis]|uniref:CidA/LrgA family protein n=1 Tax=Teichococcus vastitatis TaxID=2307076 RepID=A0ABS9W503_9PROT|nr:CidA/LrgA family protein [Pseudoroseomonas vastitatis]MCI0754372.1 CidA/LrgA family protein [Pseudoroseomonas vastitatis]